MRQHLHKARTQRDVIHFLDRRVNFERTPIDAPVSQSFRLKPMRRLLTLIGRPQDRYDIVHVAGTKGKGSTSAMIASMVSKAGYCTGLYTSPHVHSLEERIVVDGHPITEEELVAVWNRVSPAVAEIDSDLNNKGHSLTWFEIVTAMAFDHFSNRHVTLAVLETGLGGRLDATNISQPLVSVITSISIDHTAQLGRTISRIAYEKAGIIKRGIPVISGVIESAAQRVIRATATRRGSSLRELGRDFLGTFVPVCSATGLHAGRLTYEQKRIPNSRFTKKHTSTARTKKIQPVQRVPPSMKLGMPGRHQATNAAIAVAAVGVLMENEYRISAKAIVEGLASVRLPARIEVVLNHPLTVVDAAHNVASIESLLETLRDVLNEKQNRILVFSSSTDKEIEEMLERLMPHFDAVIFTRYRSNKRAASLVRLIECGKALGGAKILQASSSRAAVDRAIAMAGKKGFVCVAGSFFLAAEVRQHLHTNLSFVGC